MYLSYIRIRNHPVLGDIDIPAINPYTKKPYSIVAFVGENGSGKTSILRELFNYNKSSFLVDKEFINTKALFLRQGSLHSNSMREIGKLISGGDFYSSRNDNGAASNKKNKNNGTTINDFEQGIKLVELLGDEQLSQLFKEDHVDEVYCSQEISKLINGDNKGYDIEKYSSGQQEILLKMKDIMTMASDTDFVLLDEPETSLHPRWQKDIVRLIRLMTRDKHGNYPQFFIATHSEKVLESLIGKEDTLIVGLSKNKDTIAVKTIDEMDLRLPRVTFAELDYIVFNIPSLDYHDQLFTYFGQFFNKDSSTGIDLKVERITQKVFGKSNVQEYEKGRTFTVRNKIYFTKMLPTYIRDFFHHPGEIVPPTEEELIKSIELLRNLIQYLKEKGEEILEESDA